MSDLGELEYAWSIAEARNERICELLEELLALRIEVKRGIAVVKDYAETCSALRARVAELERERNDAYGYAKGFLQSFIDQNFPPNPDWRPLPDLLGVLTQIDNASTIARDLRARVAELEAALRGVVSGKHGHAMGCGCPWCVARAALAQESGK